MACVEIIEWSGDAHDGATYFGQPYEPAVGTVFDLADNEVRVGRRPSNDLVLPVSNVSSFHFRLIVENDRYVYEDVGSHQIPIYNEEPLPGGRRIIEDGDTFNAAGIFFRFHDS